MKLYFSYIRMVFRSVVEYRANFWMMTVGQFIGGFSAFAGMAMLFSRFGALDNWSFGEVALCFGIINVANTVGSAFTRGFHFFDHIIMNGDFDRFLLRPRTTIIQIMGNNFGFGRIGGLIQSFAVLLLGIFMTDIVWSADKIIVLTLMILSAIAIFVGLAVIYATICFYTIEGLEILNIIEDGGKEMASYPMTIFSRWMRYFFTFIIPFGCVNYIPLMYLTGRTESYRLLHIMLPLTGLFFLLPCSFLWRMGVKKYSSTGT